jgi:hypothetical protein
VIELITSRSHEELLERLDRLEATRFAPFTLLALMRYHGPTAAIWDGRSLQRIANADYLMPLASSSWDATLAESVRRGQMARLLEKAGGPHAGAFLAFHRSHAPQPGPYSPCMHRADAETVSFTWVTVTPVEANLYYSPGPPCRSLAGASLSIGMRKEEQMSCLACC